MKDSWWKWLEGIFLLVAGFFLRWRKVRAERESIQVQTAKQLVEIWMASAKEWKAEAEKWKAEAEKWKANSERLLERLNEALED